MNHQEIFEKALRSVEPMNELRQAVKKLLDEGADQTALLEELGDFRDVLQQADRETDEDVVLVVMDFMVGWCSPHMKL